MAFTIRTLGCAGAIAAGARTTAFLVDDDILIDAGTGVGDLTLEQMLKVDHIALSHSHLDHILAVPLLADSVIRLRHQHGRPPIQVWGLGATLEALRRHILNNVIWPDFTRLPSIDRPVLSLNEVAVGQALTLGTAQRVLTVMPAKHSVPGVGWAVQEACGQPAWVFSGDTSDHPPFWAALAELPLHTLVVEVAFANKEEALANISQHFCPNSLAHALRRLPRPAQVHITHIKPGEEASVMRELQALLGDRVTLVPPVTRISAPGNPPA